MGTVPCSRDQRCALLAGGEGDDGQHVRVRVGRDGQLRVTEPLGDLDEGLAGCQTERRAGVPQVVQADAREAAVSTCVREQPRDVVGLEAPPVRGSGADQRRGERTEVEVGKGVDA